jgi:hypothetical protein
MDARFCVDSLEEAIQHFGRPDIFNTDQGSQFTSDSFTGVLLKNEINISMDGRGRALDNIFVVRQEVVEIIALPAINRGDKARCAVNGSLLTQARRVTVWSEAVGTT